MIRAIRESALFSKSALFNRGKSFSLSEKMPHCVGFPWVYTDNPHISWPNKDITLWSLHLTIVYRVLALSLLAVEVLHSVKSSEASSSTLSVMFYILFSFTPYLKVPCNPNQKVLAQLLEKTTLH